MAAKRNSKKSSAFHLPQWLIPAFVTIGIIFTVLLFAEDVPKSPSDFLEDFINTIDQLLYGGPTSPDPTLPGKGEAKVYILDVGQGESILIATSEKTMLIDAGENDKGDEILDFIEKLGLDHIDYMLATHPHSDHIGGMDTVLNSIPVGEVLFGDVPDSMIPTTKTYSDVLEALESNNVPLSLTKAGDSYDLGSGAVITILGPLTQEVEKLNNTSVVCRLDFGETSFLFNGDQEKEMEALLVENQAALNCDMMTMGHHGSSTSSTPMYLDAVDPQYAAISCGRGNIHGHPHQKILDILEDYGVEYYRTDLSGNITFSTNGHKITVHPQKL